MIPFDHLVIRNSTMIDHTDPVFRSWLKDLLGAEDCTIVFTKTDGTEREMKCTLRSEVVSKYVRKGSAGKVDTDTLAVWDIEADGWRSFRYDSIKSINFTLGEVRK